MKESNRNIATRKIANRKKLNKSRRGGASFQEAWLSDVWQSREHQANQLYHYVNERNVEKVKLYISRIQKWGVARHSKKNTPQWSRLRKGPIFTKAAGLACKLGYSEIVNLFIKHIKGDVDFSRTDNNICDVFTLIEDGHRDLAKMFLENNIHTPIPFWSESMKERVNKALDLAEEKGWPEIASLIREKMVKPNNYLPYNEILAREQTLNVVVNNPLIKATR